MNEFQKLNVLRQKLVELRRQAVDEALQGADVGSNPQQISNLQASIEAVDRAIDDEKRLALSPVKPKEAAKPPAKRIRAPGGGTGGGGTGWMGG